MPKSKPDSDTLFPDFPERYLKYAKECYDSKSPEEIEAYTTTRRKGGFFGYRESDAKTTLGEIASRLNKKKESILFFTGPFGGGKSCLTAQMAALLLKKDKSEQAFSRYLSGQNVFDTLQKLKDFIRLEHYPTVLVIDDFDFSEYERLASYSTVLRKLMSSGTTILINGQLPKDVEFNASSRITRIFPEALHIRLPTHSRRRLKHSLASNQKNIIVLPDENQESIVVKQFNEGKIKILWIKHNVIDETVIPKAISSNAKLFMWHKDKARLCLTRELEQTIFSAYEANQPLIIISPVLPPWREKYIDIPSLLEMSGSELHQNAIGDRLKQEGVILDYLPLCAEESASFEEIMRELALSENRKSSLLKKVEDLLKMVIEAAPRDAKLDKWGMPCEGIRTTLNHLSWQSKSPLSYRSASVQLATLDGGGVISSGMFGCVFPLSISLLYGLLVEELVSKILKLDPKSLLVEFESKSQLKMRSKTSVQSPFQPALFTSEIWQYDEKLTFSGFCLEHMKMGIYQNALESLFIPKQRSTYSLNFADIISVLRPKIETEAREILQHINRVIEKILKAQFPDEVRLTRPIEEYEKQSRRGYGM